MKKILFSFTLLVTLLFSFTIPQTRAEASDIYDETLMNVSCNATQCNFFYEVDLLANSDYAIHFDWYNEQSDMGSYIHYADPSSLFMSGYVTIVDGTFDDVLNTMDYTYTTGATDEYFELSGYIDLASYNDATSSSLQGNIFDDLYIDIIWLGNTAPVDTVEPEFSYSNLSFNTRYYNLVSEPAIKAQLSAVDNQDGDVSSRIEVYEDHYTSEVKVVGGDYYIMYRVSDTSGNYAYLRVDLEVIDDLKPYATYNSTTYEDGDSLSFTWYNDSTAATKLDLNEIRALFTFADGYDSVGDLTINVYSDYTGEDEYYDAVGNHVVTVAIEDLSGNVAEIYVNITVLSNQAPVITGDASKTLEVTNINIANILATYSANDAEDGVVSVTVDPTNTWNYAAPTPGSFTLKLKAVDSLGKVTNKLVAITVQDTTPPVIKIGGIASTSYTHEVLMSDTTSLQALIDTITAIDSYNGDLTGSLVIPAFPSFTTPGQTLMTITSTDSSGNIGSLALTVNVVDDIAPVINGSVKIVKGQTATLTLSQITAELNAVDNVDGSLTLELISDAYTGHATETGAYLVKYKATDSSGNISYHEVRVWVVDNVAPVWISNDFFVNLGMNETMSRTELIALLQASGMIANDISYTVTFVSDEYTGNETVEGVYSVVMHVTYDDGSEENISVELNVPNPEDDSITVIPETPQTGLMKFLSNVWNFIKSIANFIKNIGVWIYDHILLPTWNGITWLWDFVFNPEDDLDIPPVTTNTPTTTLPPATTTYTTSNPSANL